MIDKIKYYFVELICERKIMSKELNKLDWIAALDFMTKFWLSYQEQSVWSFVIDIGTSVGIASASIDLVFFYDDWIAEKYSKIMRKKTKQS